MLKGYSYPLSPKGEMNLAPAPPWHYAGDMLGVEYWTSPVAAALTLPLPVVLDALCRLLDGTAEGCFSSVLLLDHTGTKIAHAAAPGLPTSYREFLKGRLVTCAEGPCGMTVTLNKQVIVSDVESDTRWESGDYPAVALSYGVKSCWSSPIRSLTGELLGTLVSEAGKSCLL